MQGAEWARRTGAHRVSSSQTARLCQLPVTVCSLAAPSQVTLDLQNSSEKFGGFLRSALDVLAQILELATLQDIGKVCVSFLLRELELAHLMRTPWAKCLWGRDPHPPGTFRQR